MSNSGSINQRHLIVWKSNHIAPSYLEQWMKRYPGDWITITPDSRLRKALAPDKVRSLLGQEFTHVVFDARSGFNLDAFAILSGTVKRGSFFILILSEEMSTWLDEDTVRWNTSDLPMMAPNFVYHLKNVLAKYGVPVLHLPLETLSTQPLLVDLLHGVSSSSLASCLRTFKPTNQQQALLTQLQSESARVVALTASRGRGKSALAGFFTHQEVAWLCAPSQAVLKTTMYFAKNGTPVWAPDELLRQLKAGMTAPPWIIIDEAAAIPISVLKDIIQYAKRLFLVTTTEGYEGTGQGFLLRLLSIIPDVKQYHLSDPMRWDETDQLASVTNALLLKSNRIFCFNHNNKDNTFIQIDKISSSELVKDEDQLSQFYGLLKRAHYKTTATDLRRILDGQHISLLKVNLNDDIVGACMMVKEGQLSSTLCNDIWNGYRRPRGNLVAQSLVAQGGQIIAGQLMSLRINRLAIEPQLHRCGIGKKTVEYIIGYGQSAGYDFISVSFAYEQGIYAFWKTCGFELVHIGSHLDASSGAPAIIAVYAFTSAAEKMKQRLHDRVKRNAYWMRRKLDITLFNTLPFADTLNRDEWRELWGFAFGMRCYETMYPILRRLKKQSIDRNADSLLSSINDERRAIARFKLTGKKAFIRALRDEIKCILTKIGYDNMDYIK